MTEDRSTERTGGVASAKGGQQLPRYSRPPVVEVAIAVQFDELPDFELVHFGLLWERFRNRYPLTEHHAPLPPVVELFGSQGTQRASLGIEFNLESKFPIGRCWYLREDGLRLLQVQPDRFIVNWRKLESQTDYPSYDVLRATFDEELDVFLTFARENGLGEFQPTQCELTYINHLLADRGWASPTELSNVLAPWSGRNSEPYLPAVEDIRFAWQYRFEERGSPLGRLYVQLQSGIRSTDRAPVLAVTLTARGAPSETAVGGVLSSLDRMHEWIVRGFTAITTDQMHEIWERQK